VVVGSVGYKQVVDEKLYWVDIGRLHESLEHSVVYFHSCGKEPSSAAI